MAQGEIRLEVATPDDFLRDLLGCWRIVHRRQFDITAADLVAQLLLFRHLEARELAGKRSDNEEAVRSRRLVQEMRFRGICSYCYRRPVDYSVSVRWCTRCATLMQEYNRKKRERRKEKLHEDGRHTTNA